MCLMTRNVRKKNMKNRDRYENMMLYVEGEVARVRKKKL